MTAAMVILLVIIAFAIFVFFSSEVGPKEINSKKFGAPLLHRWKSRWQDQVDYFKNSPL